MRHGCLDCRRTYSVKFTITIRLELYVQLQLFSYSSNQPLYHLQGERFVQPLLQSGILLVSKLFFSSVLLDTTFSRFLFLWLLRVLAVLRLNATLIFSFIIIIITSSADTFLTFKNRLKTELFRSCFLRSRFACELTCRALYKFICIALYTVNNYLFSSLTLWALRVIIIITYDNEYHVVIWTWHIILGIYVSLKKVIEVFQHWIHSAPLLIYKVRFVVGPRRQFS